METSLGCLNTILNAGGGYQLAFRGRGVLYYSYPYPEHSGRASYVPPGTTDLPSLRSHRSNGLRALSFDDGPEAAHEASIVSRIEEVCDGDEDPTHSRSVAIGEG